jgi:hypothetical protein
LVDNTLAVGVLAGTGVLPGTNDTARINLSADGGMR